MESSFMGSKRLTPTIVGKMALKRLYSMTHCFQLICHMLESITTFISKIHLSKKQLTNKQSLRFKALC